MNASIKTFAIVIFLIIGANAQAQTLKGTKNIDTEQYATVNVYDKANNLIEEIILMDKLSHEEAMNQVDDMVSNLEDAKRYTIISPKNFTLVSIYNKRGKILKEVVLKEEMSAEETMDMVENLDMMNIKKAKYYTINDGQKKF